MHIYESANFQEGGHLGSDTPASHLSSRSMTGMMASKGSNKTKCSKMGGCKPSPYHTQYIRLKLINACFVSQSSLEPLLVLILLAYTDLGCKNFMVFYQTILQACQIVSQIFWQFISAGLTDRTANWAQYFLLITLVVQTATDIAMWFASHNKWAVLVLFIIRFALVQQIGNSVGKIFKMRIQLVLNMLPEEQMKVFNNLSISGDFLGRLIAVCGVYGVALLWNKLGHLTFEQLRVMFFIALLGWDLIAIVCTASIRPRYFVPVNIDELEDTGLGDQMEGRTSINHQANGLSQKTEFDEDLPEEGKIVRIAGHQSAQDAHSSNGWLSPTSPFSSPSGSFKLETAKRTKHGTYSASKVDEEKRKLALLGNESGSESDGAIRRVNSNIGLVHSRSFHEQYEIDTPLIVGKIIDDPGPNPTLDPNQMGLFSYVVYCIKSFFNNELLLKAMIHLWSVTTLLAFVMIVLRFSVASQGTDDDPTLDNFCGGLLLNLIEVQLAQEVCRLLGAVLYQGYMNRITALHFYRIVYCVYAGINALLLMIVIWPVGATAGSFVLGIITVFIYISMIYTANIASVVMDSAMAGFVFGIQGSGIQLLALIPVGIAMAMQQFSIPDSVVTGYCVMHSVWSACFSIYFAISCRKGLSGLDDNPPSKSKLKKCLLGY